MLITGRVISGISVGIASTVIPLYQSEITAPSIRGRLVSIQQWSITWGILLQYFIQFGCSYINGVASFRIPWGLQIIPAIILSIGMLTFPESPRWLFDHHRCVSTIAKTPTRLLTHRQRGRGAHGARRLARKREYQKRAGTARVRADKAPGVL
jgi:MFS family permease